MEQQLQILSESLDQKVMILEDIQTYNNEMQKMLSGGIKEVEEFDRLTEERGELLERLEHLDEGFEILYDKIKDGLSENKDHFSSQIKEIQTKIVRVTDLTTAITAQGVRIRDSVDQYFKKEREELRQGRQNSKAVYDYYRNMSGAAYNPAQFMDQKH